MREIKFRAWDKINKQMLVPLSGIVWGKACVPTDYVQGLFDYNTPDNYSYWGDGEMMLVDNCEIMQCTGLRDKNSKEIYEGDILDNSSDLNNAAVQWGRLGDGEHETDCYGFIVPQGLHEWHVKGNIYENPHLIKE